MSPSSTQSTFRWTLSNEGLGTDKNQIDGLRTGNLLIVNFREVSAETTDTLIVQEINPSTGCESIPDSIFIQVKPTPEANITYNGKTTLSQGDGRRLLTGEGGVAGNEQPGGVFTGPGVVQDELGNYYIDPSILSETNLSDPSDDVIITFTYADGFGCSATAIERFNIFGANASFQNLQAQYCYENIEDTIYVIPDIIDANFEVVGIEGPGITEIGLEEEIINGSAIQVFKAIFNPAIAFDSNPDVTNPSNIEITYSTQERANPSNVVLGLQAVRVNPLPTLAFRGPEYDLCTYDEAADLEREDSNNLLTYQFSLVNEGLPAGLLLGDSIVGFQFDPAPLFNYLDSIGEESIEIEMEYRYTNASGCSDSESFTFNVYKQPDQPELNFTDFCVVNGEFEEAVITNYVGTAANSELEWFTNSNLSGQAINRGLSFTPTAAFFASSDSVTFYVARKNNNSSGEHDELCGSAATAVTYRLLGNPDFSWNKSSFGSGPVRFTATQSENDVASYLWRISKITSSGLELLESRPITNLDNLAFEVDFEQYGAGQYQVDFTVITVFACSTTSSQQLLILPEIVSSTNYAFDFEESNEGWVPSIDTNNSWEWNTPADTSKIQTQGSFWITNASGSYNPGEQSYVYSPVMDISGIDKPAVNFDLWLDVIKDVDGLVLEYSTDNLILENPAKQWQLLGNFDDGNVSGLNWYESTAIRSRPGTNDNNLFGQGWSREAEDIAAVLEAKHALSEIPVSERSNVIFRFQFKSNISGFLPDGVAFDNFRIESLNRNVLIEYFGDETAEDDQLEMNTLSAEFNASSSFSWINYRIDEEDPLFEQSTSAMLSRIYQYTAYNDGSRFALDGKMKKEYSFSSEAGINDLRNSQLVSSNVNMDMTVDLVAGRDDQMKILVDYSNITNFTENDRLFISVVQKQIADGDFNTNQDKIYYNVLRKILPDVGGINLVGKNQEQLLFNFTATQASDTATLRLIAFIQNIETGEIYQSVSVHEVPRLEYSTVTSNRDFENMSVQMYPNPAKEKLQLSFGSKLSGKVSLKVTDLTGKTIKELQLNAGTIKYEMNTRQLNTGMYNLLLKNEQGAYKMLKFAVTN
jgi:hypothetical protein